MRAAKISTSDAATKPLQQTAATKPLQQIAATKPLQLSHCN